MRPVRSVSERAAAALREFLGLESAGGAAAGHAAAALKTQQQPQAKGNPMDPMQWLTLIVFALTILGREGAPSLKVRRAGPDAIGDLNGDGRPDAAVVTATETGGSGTFMALAAVLDDQGTPRQVAGVPLGDRVKVDSVSIADGTIEIALVRHGPQDALCCPTQAATLRYRLADNRLVPAKP